MFCCVKCYDSSSLIRMIVLIVGLLGEGLECRGRGVFGGGGGGLGGDDLLNFGTVVDFIGVR